MNAFSYCNYHYARQWRLNHPAVVYEILNMENNFRYIGASFFFKQRKGDHLTCLKRNVHANKNLQADWNKYGRSSFKFNILSKHKTLRLALVREKRIIQNSSLLYNIIQYKELEKILAS